jgi:hypothetical protein
MSLSKTPRSFSIIKQKPNKKELEIKMNFLIRNLKNDLHNIEEDEEFKFFNVSKPVGKLHQLLRRTTDFNLYTTIANNENYYQYNEKTAKEVIKNIYEYLINKKDKKIKNLKKNRTGISYEYLHTIITIKIASDNGVVSIFIHREIN